MDARSQKRIAGPISPRPSPTSMNTKFWVAFCFARLCEVFAETTRGRGEGIVILENAGWEKCSGFIRVEPAYLSCVNCGWCELRPHYSPEALRLQFTIDGKLSSASRCFVTGSTEVRTKIPTTGRKVGAK